MKKMQGRLMLDNGTFTLIIDCTPYTIQKGHPNYQLLLKNFKDNDAESFVKNYDVQAKFESAGLTLKSGRVYLNGKEFSHKICDEILKLFSTGCSVEPLFNLLKNLLENPSKTAVDEAFDFFSIHGLPITDDGCFLAYKSVRSNYMDKYTGTISNHVGAKVSVPRNSVDDKRDNHCSNGLHAGAWGYAGKGGWYNSSGDKVVLVKINPKDIVTVPSDHSFQKLRVCAYEVVGEFKDALPQKSAVYNDKLEDTSQTLSDYCEDYLDVDDLVIDDAYSFIYNGETRYGSYLGLSDSGHPMFYMMGADKSQYETRQFRGELMEEIEFYE